MPPKNAKKNRSVKRRKSESAIKPRRKHKKTVRFSSPLEQPNIHCHRKNNVVFCHSGLEQRESAYGTGTFATTPILKDAEILREKTHNLEESKQDDTYIFKLIRKLLDDSNVKPLLDDLVPHEPDEYMPHFGDPQETMRQQFLPEIPRDRAHLYYTKYKRNNFGFGDNPGFLFYGTKMNHSCDPNIHYEKDCDHMVFRATRNIQPGEELFDSYINSSMSKSDRQQELLRRYGFQCTCNKCKSQYLDSINIVK
jgi:hypothetical protein